METAEATSVLIRADQGVVVEELERLKQKLGVGHELTVKWLPGKKLEICGEVKGDCIYVYEEEEQKALETVKHEFLDYLISKTIEPYQKIANKLIGLINDESYLRKEKLVDILAALI
jgi:regulator of sigma D